MPDIDDLELEINENDASCDMSKLPKSRGEFKRSIAGILVALTLFSGSLIGPTTAYAAELDTPPSQSQDIDDENSVIEIPEEHAWEVADMCGKEIGEPITIKDLKEVKDSFVSITALTDSNLEWINYLGQVDYLSIIIRADNTEMLRKIESIPGVENLSLISMDDTHELNEEDFAFIKNTPQLKGLSISGLKIHPGFIESLQNLKVLTLFADENIDIDFRKLTNLDELDLSISDPYDIAIDFTKEEYDLLKNSGVKIEFHSDEFEKMYLEISEKLDNIARSLPVDKDSTDREKLDAILVYVLEKLDYDSDVANLLFLGEDTSHLSKTFYENGALYGALEKDSAICGNYAALTGALAKRIGLESYYAVSNDHAWNIIEIDGEQYYVDSTWLDSSGLREQTTTSGITESGQYYTQTTFTSIPAEQAIKDGRQDELEWYMEDPTNLPESKEHKESHDIINLPSYIKLVPIKTEESQEETITENENIEIEETKPIEKETPTIEETESIKITKEDKFELHVGDKMWIVSGAVAFGVLSGIGGIVAVKKKKKEEERKRRQRQTNLDDMFYPYDTSITSYGGDADPFADDFFEQPPTTKKGNKRGRR